MLCESVSNEFKTQYTPQRESIREVGRSRSLCQPALATVRLVISAAIKDAILARGLTI